MNLAFFIGVFIGFYLGVFVMGSMAYAGRVSKAEGVDGASNL